MGKSFIPIDVELDPAPLLARITPEMWEQETRRQDYPGTVHAQTQAIYLRWADLAEDEPVVEAVYRNFNTIDWPMAAELMPEAGELITALMAETGGHLGRVMITRLPAGAAIPEHIDEGLYAKQHDRFHLCLQGDSCLFKCGEVEIRTKPGDAFWVNNKRPHRVLNGGKGDRIHLIADLSHVPEYTQHRGITYQGELVSDLWGEVEPLLQEHWEEIAADKSIPLDPAKDQFQAMEDAGMLHCYTVRDIYTLIGYVCFVVTPGLHYKGSLQAHQDVLFLTPEYRRGRVGLKLLQYAEQRLAALGVEVAFHHVKRTNQVGRLLERLGYHLVDEVYAKRLDIGD